MGLHKSFLAETCPLWRSVKLQARAYLIICSCSTFPWGRCVLSDKEAPTFDSTYRRASTFIISTGARTPVPCVCSSFAPQNSCGYRSPFCCACVDACSRYIFVKKQHGALRLGSGPFGARKNSLDYNSSHQTPCETVTTCCPATLRPPPSLSLFFISLSLCTRASHNAQGLGVIVVAAVAFLAVAQQQLRGGGGSGLFYFFFQDDDERENFGVETAVGGDGENLDGAGGQAGNSNSDYSGLVGLSLAYALPIVGDLIFLRVWGVLLCDVLTFSSVRFFLPSKRYTVLRW